MNRVSTRPPCWPPITLRRGAARRCRAWRDYAPVKSVKNPAASRPGMVVYTTYQTMYVDPDGELVKKLGGK